MSGLLIVIAGCAIIAFFPVILFAGLFILSLIWWAFKELIEAWKTTIYIFKESCNTHCQNWKDYWNDTNRL